MLIRRATPDDVHGIHAVHVSAIREVCAPFYEPKQIEAWSAGKAAERYVEPILKGYFYVAVASDQIVGFSELDPDKGEVCAVFVRPDSLRQGVGRRLLEELEVAARGLELGRLFLSSTVNAAPFYAAHGYVSDGAELFTLRSGKRIPCIRMHKDFELAPSRA